MNALEEHLEGAADVEDAALAHVALTCLCVQGWRTLPGAEQEWDWLLP